MTDYLASMIARSRDAVGAVRPRVGSLFESPQAIVEPADDAPGEGPASHALTPQVWTAAPELGWKVAPPGGAPTAGPSPAPPDGAAPVRGRTGAALAGTRHPATTNVDLARRTARAEEGPDQGAPRRPAAVAATPTGAGVRTRRRADTPRPARRAAVSSRSVKPAPPAEPGEAGHSTPTSASRRARPPAPEHAASAAGTGRTPSGAVAPGAAPVQPPAAATLGPLSATSTATGSTAAAAQPGAAPARADGELIAAAPSTQRRPGTWVEPVIWPAMANPAGATEARVGEEPAPVVQVTIGRVEVRASAQAPAASTARPVPSPAMTLDDYLRRRTSRRDR